MMKKDDEHVCINCEHYFPKEEMDEKHQKEYQDGEGACWEGGFSILHLPTEAGKDCNSFKLHDKGD